MKLYNTLSRSKEEFIPLTPGVVKMYSCGPTVYHYFHIGNARPFIIFDTLRRFLEYSGYQVTFVQNFTDVDDRMIRLSNEQGKGLKEFADHFIAEYFVDADGLGIKRASYHPRATECIPEMISIISDLINKGHAYEVNGDVYYSTRSFNEYGKLSHYCVEDLESGARVDIGEDKRDPLDFALWKAQKPGEPAWESPWGMGRPGWHIECSAMSRSILGETIDIHSGGLDLIFPHHENEIAQSEAANGKPFARYWLHNGFLTIDNEKMSKSLGNFFTVRDVVAQFPYEVIRYFLLSAHYRSPINFADELLKQAQNGLDRLYECKESLKFQLSLPTTHEDTAESILDWSSYQKRFEEAMSDDLNTADAISVLFEMVRALNTAMANKASKTDLAAGLEMLLKLSDVLGLLGRKEESIDSEIEALIEQRQIARKEKNWAESDRIRDLLKEKGVELKDTAQGVQWQLIKH